MSPSENGPSLAPARTRLFGPKVALARALGAVSRRSGRGGGTTLPGRVLLRTAPDAMERLGRGLDQGTTIVSATNGKTTTAAMIASALERAGRSPVHNRAGSNMAWGVTTALLEQQGGEGLFEVDEAWLPRVAEALGPQLIVLCNLFRDQLDRYGELERLADEWSELVALLPADCGLALNADDPLVADLGRGAKGAMRPNVTYFGVEDTSQALDAMQHAHDAKHCRRCGAAYVYTHTFIGHLGHYSCPNCDADRPDPAIAATHVELHGIDGSSFEVSTPAGPLSVELPVPGLYNVYNALAAIAAGLRLGLTLEQVGAGLEAMKAVFGRVETIAVEGKPVSILLIKNPVGANEVVRTLALEAERGDAADRGLDVWIALNDGIADGRDVSWVWDADFELLAGDIRRVTCAGTRAPEMAVRLKYAGVPSERIEVIEPIAESLDSARAAAPERLFALPTYTALLELRTLLSRRGLAEEYWR